MGRLDAYGNAAAADATLRRLKADEYTGDILTATIWSYFASLNAYGIVAASQTTLTTRNGEYEDGTRSNQAVTTGMYDRSGLVYGLFHAQAQPNKLFNAVTTGISFKGVNMDVGHLRSVRWVKDSGLDVNSGINLNDPTQQQAAVDRAAADTKRRWINYNRLRGQHASAMEHLIPERAFLDKTQCRYTDQGDPTAVPPIAPRIVNPNAADCAEAISAVRAVAIARDEGQKIFRITPSNAAQAIPLLQHRSSVIDEVRAAVQVGNEVVIHEKAITKHGWTGAGYAVIDPNTGAGAYLIEGKGNGAFMVAFIFMALAIIVPVLLLSAGVIGTFAGVLAIGLSFANFLDFVGKIKNISNEKDFNDLAAAKTLSAILSLLGFGIKAVDFSGALGAEALQIAIPLLFSGVGFITGLAVTDDYRAGCIWVFFDCSKEPK